MEMILLLFVIFFGILIIRFFLPLYLGKFPKPFFTLIVESVLIVLMILDTVINGMKYFLVGTYIPIIVLFIIDLVFLVKNRKIRVEFPRWKKIVRTIFGIWVAIQYPLLIAIVVLLQSAGPPPLSGKYLVGYTTIELEDREREEIYTKESDHRRIKCSVWYPASNTEGCESISYTDKRTMKIFARVMQFPMVEGGDIPSRSYSEARIAEGRFPVLLFNHGFISYPEQNMTSCENLASNGFIVIGIYHPYETLFTHFKDGTEIEISDSVASFMQDQQTPENLRALAETFSALHRASTTEDKRNSLHRVLEETAYNTIRSNFNEWYRDSELVLDRLQKIDIDGGIISGHIDSARIGAFGHSFGGIVSGQLLLNDSRVRAAVVYDAPLLPFLPDGNEVTTKPVMYMYGENPVYGKYELYTRDANRYYTEKAEGDFYNVEIEGAGHFNFCDLNYAPRILRFFPIMGKIDQERAGEIVTTYTTNFFRTYLMEDRNHDSLKSHYPEVTMEYIPGKE